MRIGIVNDVRTVAEALRHIVTKSGENQVAWIAHDGAEAVQKCKRDTPDLILMDLVMPVMNGVEATRQIMKESPCPILIVTASVTGHSTLVFETMGAGALDVVRTPELGPGGGVTEAKDLLRKIETISRLTGKTAKVSQRTNFQEVPGKIHHKMPPLLVIGASTGGPMALAKVLSTIPVRTPLAIVVVQHVDSYFAEGLASWLADQTQFPVRVAVDGDIPKSGLVLLAGRDEHMAINSNNQLKYSTNGADKFYCPSVNVFFQSVAAHWATPGIAVLLTGMGTDGAQGLKALHDKGWFTIAEHQSSCIVYGMPKAAVDIGAATEIVPLEKIGHTIIEVLSSRKL